MTELKTLKDIRTEVDIKTEELDLITELRAEAIKWIKAYDVVIQQQPSINCDMDFILRLGCNTRI